jgi:pyruvate,orthophosphate dikinase
VKQGDWITLDGSRGSVYLGKLSLVKPNIKKNQLFNNLLQIINQNKKIIVRANADSKKDAITALALGAGGIGLCRTEHMFFEPKRIIAIRKMIVATNIQDRKLAIMELLPYQKNDFYKILKAMNNKSVTIRLLDPPLHEFLPVKNEQIVELANSLNVTKKQLNQTIESLHEANPMLGHRGCRLGITYPEITEMQTLAIVKATVQLIKEGYNPKPEIMIPLVGSLGEFIHQKDIVQSVIKQTLKKHTIKSINLKIGTMIELPRACLIADKIALHADFLSFGTNDLTQTTFGFSRDDIGSFLPEYLNKKIISSDPFQVLDASGVGELIIIAIKKARSIKSNIKIGICGEHGGDPRSIKFLVDAGVDYLSCSPYRVPIAGLTLSQLS